MSTVTVARIPTALGLSLPADVPHGVSVSLPTWEDNVGYERGDSRVMDKLTSGYPRFYIHTQIQRLQAVCERKFGLPHERCHIFPSLRIAEACRAFMHAHSPDTSHPVLVRIAQFLIQAPDSPLSLSSTPVPKDFSIELHIVFFPAGSAPLAKQFWQHTGNGISSRMAERCLSLLPSQDVPSEHIAQGYGIDSPPTTPGAWTKSRNRHYAGLKKGTHATSASTEAASLSSGKDEVTDGVAVYLEERYGRNMPVSAAALAKGALRRRIAGVMVHDEIPLSGREVRRGSCVTEGDVYLYPTGMSAIWHSHQLALATFSPAKSVCFGFPYLDTYKILLKWGPGCHFFGYGLDSDIDTLTTLLASSPSTPDTPPILALYCEFPSNPLLRSPNLARLRKLADEYGFLIVVDETIGSFANVEILPFADIIVSSLTKVFSGETNVMGGSLVLNPLSPHYHALKEKMTATYEDVYWMEDAIYLERNSRDFAPRVYKINRNSEALCGFLRSKSLVYRQQQGGDVKSNDDVPIVMKEVYYPKWSTPENYETCRLGSPTQSPQSKAMSPERDGGYGGLFSITFTSDLASEVFFDALPCEKGPSLGTNFTLACPYTILAHYTELEWAAEYGVEAGLVRVSVGLEDEGVLIAWFSEALRKAEEAVRARQD